MPVLEILTYPNPLLKQLSQPVVQFDESTARLIDDLLATLEAHPGCVGLAAPQTGNMHRLIVVDVSRNRKPVPNHGLMVLINPEIEREEGEVIAREGCLSLPDFTANVKRARSIRCRALDRHGETFTFDAEDFEARVVLHEIDHLDGKLFLDRVSSLKTDVFRRKRYAASPANVNSSGQ